MEEDKFNQLNVLVAEKINESDNELSDYKKKNNIAGKITDSYQYGINKGGYMLDDGMWFVQEDIPEEIQKLYLKAYASAKSELGL